MQGLISGIKRMEIHDGDGLRTTVFFKGCSLNCKWCHNPESFTPKIELLYDAELCQNCLSCTKLCSANRFDSCGNHIFIREDCVKCGKCETNCPQSIKIREELEKIENQYNLYKHQY